MQKETQNSKLVLFTADFPFGSGETFLETEIKYLANGFQHVLIISANTRDAQTRQLPANCTTERIDLSLSLWDKLLSFKGLFSPIFWKEIQIVRNVYKMKYSKGILKTMLISLFRGQRVARKINSLQASGFSADTTVYYSYWCDDAALGLAIGSNDNPQLKTLCRLHGWDVYFERNRFLYLPFRQYIYNHISAMFCISEHAMNYAKKIWQVNGEKLKLARLGVEEQTQLKERNDGIFTLVSCSAIIPIKQVHLIAEAIKLLDGHFPLRWVHIGDGPEKKRIEDLIAGLSDTTEVRLMGRIPNSEVLKCYRDLAPDVFINVSSSEGVPVSIMEVMSLGIPVIATNVGGTSEIVHQNNGYLLDTDRIKHELVDVLKKFKDMNTEIKSKLSKEAYQTWYETYNSKKNYHDFVSMIQKL